MAHFGSMLHLSDDLGIPANGSRHIQKVTCFNGNKDTGGTRRVPASRSTKNYNTDSGSEWAMHKLKESTVLNLSLLLTSSQLLIAVTLNLYHLTRVDIRPCCCSTILKILWYQREVWQDLQPKGISIPRECNMRMRPCPLSHQQDEHGCNFEMEPHFVDSWKTEVKVQGHFEHKEFGETIRWSISRGKDGMIP